MMKNYFTAQNNFYGDNSPHQLIKTYGSPLYVYNEAILRKRCREMAGLVSYPDFKVNYSTKANANLALLRIIREEGLHADAMSPGEIFVLLAAGFKPEEIFYVGNNVSDEELLFAIERDITVSVDSLSQLAKYGKLNPGGKVALRFNPGVGAGHHDKVVTGGKKTKFGINMDLISETKKIAEANRLKVIGINQHIGSLFMTGDSYIEGAKTLLGIAEQFEGLLFADLGGGFGIPYRKQEGEGRLDLRELGERLDHLLENWSRRSGKKICFKIEPGRYVVAEAGVVLGTVHTLKRNYSTDYVGTDIGMNVLVRPSMYDAHHDIELYSEALPLSNEKRRVTVVGNICESGDIIAKDRQLPDAREGDILGVMDAGAYGYSMCSNYNNRLRPAEVLIKTDGSASLIRRRDTYEDLARNFEVDLCYK